MSYLIEESENLCRQAKLVTLHSVLVEAPSLEELFEVHTNAKEKGRHSWLERQPFRKYSKEELIGHAKKHDIAVRSSAPKSEILTAVEQAEWSRTGIFAAYRAAQDEVGRIRIWAKKLRKLPDRLDEVIAEADRCFADWQESQKAEIHRAASDVRNKVLPFLEWEDAANEAKKAKASLASGKSHADVVEELFSAISMAVMGLIPQNASASGQGLSAISALGAAKKLTWAVRDMVPEQAMPFLATTYRL